MRKINPAGVLVSEHMKSKANQSREYRDELNRLMPLEQIARQFIRIRMEASLTQAELAEKVGTTKSVISRLESGSHSPNVQTLEKIAQVLGGHISVSFDLPSAHQNETEGISHAI